ncbi:hypothetical protein COO60DRAFT_1493330, partial [Scenedesmus sp. NREL 46B-D3]
MLLLLQLLLAALVLLRTHGRAPQRLAAATAGVTTQHRSTRRPSLLLLLTHPLRACVGPLDPLRLDVLVRHAAEQHRIHALLVA